MRDFKKILKEMCLSLTRAGFDCAFHISHRGVPYVHVVVGGQRYQFTYFGRGRFFRIFDSVQNRNDRKNREDVIEFFKSLQKETA